jgi:hypothetical protein
LSGDRLHVGEVMTDDGSKAEIIAQELSRIGSRVAAIEARLSDLDKVTARLEGAAITTARALQEVSRHWDAVYEAMRRNQPGESEG